MKYVKSAEDLVVETNGLNNSLIKWKMDYKDCDYSEFIVTFNFTFKN